MASEHIYDKITVMRDGEEICGSPFIYKRLVHAKYIDPLREIKKIYNEKDGYTFTLKRNVFGKICTRELE